MAHVSNHGFFAPLDCNLEQGRLSSKIVCYFGKKILQGPTLNVSMMTARSISWKERKFNGKNEKKIGLHNLMVSAGAQWESQLINLIAVSASKDTNHSLKTFAYQSGAESHSRCMYAGIETWAMMLQNKWVENFTVVSFDRCFLFGWRTTPFSVLSLSLLPNVTFRINLRWQHIARNADIAPNCYLWPLVLLESAG